MKKIVSLAAALALVVGASTAAQAQCTSNGCTITHNLTATAPTVLDLSLSTASTALTNPVAGDFDGAALVNVGPTATLKSNKSAHAQISAAAWTMPVGATKAVGDVSYDLNTSGTYIQMTTTPTDIIVPGKGNRNVALRWSTLWKLATDEPGAYTLPVTFTLVSP